MSTWTSESVSCGHPDKVADQIADAILDAYLTIDPDAKVACEVTLTKDLILVTGEIGSQAYVDIVPIVRNTLIGIGYKDDKSGYNANKIPILNNLNTQSTEIAQAVVKDYGEIGAGDQGIMLGYASDQTPELLPLVHMLPRKYILGLRKLYEKDPSNNWLRPDAKAQVSLICDEDGTPQAVGTVVISTQSALDLKALRWYLQENLCEPIAEQYPGFFKYTNYLLNPAGEWSLGGPAADTGLSGRKIVVDNYGPDFSIGGGSFSGKDPTKVDRSGAYACRYIAKNIVYAGLASQCQVQISYAIGVSKPTSFKINTYDTSAVQNTELERKIYELIDLSPRGIIERFSLRRPIYTQTAAKGHFGWDHYPWEQVDLCDKLESVFSDSFV